MARTLIQVFNINSMSDDLFDEFISDLECTNGSFIRWYPGTEHFMLYPETSKKIDNWLVENGMIVDENDKKFYVLLSVSW